MMKIDTRRKNKRRRGSTMVEFSLVFLLLMGLLVGAFDLNYPVYVRTALHHAAREGSRFAITGRTLPGLGHDDSIREVVRRNALGLLEGAKKSKIKIRYYAADGSSETSQNAAGNIVNVAVEQYEVKRAVPLFWSGQILHLTAGATDRMSFFLGSPPAR